MLAARAAIGGATADQCLKERLCYFLIVRTTKEMRARLRKSKRDQPEGHVKLKLTLEKVKQRKKKGSRTCVVAETAI